MAAHSVRFFEAQDHALSLISKAQQRGVTPAALCESITGSPTAVDNWPDAYRLILDTLSATYPDWSEGTPNG